MTIYNVTEAELQTALNHVSARYSGNIKFRHLDQVPTKTGRTWILTLGVYSSREPGSRLSFDLRRRVAAACWHAHGHFFDELLKIAPAAVIKTSRYGTAKIDVNGGNWTDFRIGSQFMPTMMSEACRCAEEGRL